MDATPSPRQEPDTIKLPALPDAYRWRFKAGNDRTWRHCATMPGFDPAIVESEPLFIAADRAERAAPTPTLTTRLQQQCSDWGVYWRAPDAHGVELSIEQAAELLRDALGVEVEIGRERAAPGAVPEGWRLVPIEPTSEMLKEGGHANSEWLNDNAPIGEARYARPMQSVWAGMLAAAPVLPASPAPPVKDYLTTANTPEIPDSSGTTAGHLCQDLDSGLSQALADKPGAMRLAREAAAEIPAEHYCLVCEKAGHLTTECRSTVGLNTPANRELMRLCHAALNAATTHPQAAPVLDERAADPVREALVRRLRDTPNWQRESFAHWKDATSVYDRAPFEAADEIERLQAALAQAPAVQGRDLALEEAAQEFDRRDKHCGGFYDPHEPAEIIRGMKSKAPAVREASEREEFEAWAVRGLASTPFPEYSAGVAWTGWQARAALAPPVQPQAVAPLFDHDNHHNALLCPYCNPKRLVLVEPAQAVAVQPLTDEQINVISHDVYGFRMRECDIEFARAIERAHGIAPAGQGERP